MKCKDNCLLLNETAIQSMLDVRKEIDNLIDPENKKLSISKDHNLMLALTIIDNKIYDLKSKNKAVKGRYIYGILIKTNDYHWINKGGLSMIYYVIEIQTSNGAGAVIPFSFSDRNAAEAKYHALLSVCATSTVPKHGAMLFNDDGFILKSEVYNHIEPEKEV